MVSENSDFVSVESINGEILQKNEKKENKKSLFKKNKQEKREIESDISSDNTAIIYDHLTGEMNKICNK